MRRFTGDIVCKAWLTAVLYDGLRKLPDKANNVMFRYAVDVYYLPSVGHQRC